MMNTKVEEALNYYKSGEYEKAIDAFSTVVETEEPNAEIYNNIGQCYASLANDSKAEEYFVKAIELNSQLAHAYINLADIYYRNKDFGKGIGLLTNGVNAMPDNMVMAHFLARFYMEDCRLDLAIDELEKVLENQPENYDAYYDLGKVHYELGNYDCHDSGFKQAYKKVAILFLARGDYDDAVEYLEEYLDMELPEEEVNNVRILIERIKKKKVNG